MAKCIHFYSDDKYFIEYAQSESGEWFKRSLCFNPFVGYNTWSKWYNCGKATQIIHSTTKYLDREENEKVSRYIIIKFKNSEVYIPYDFKPSKFKNRLRLPF